MPKIKGWDYKGLKKIDWSRESFFAYKWVSKDRVNLGKVEGMRKDMECYWKVPIQILVFKSSSDYTNTGWAFNLMKFQNGEWQTYGSKSFPTKKEALAYAINYMRSHPNG